MSGLKRAAAALLLLAGCARMGLPPGGPPDFRAPVLLSTYPESTTVLPDFDGWVEQRGSKFFTEWDAAYTAMIATHDQGQEPQKGGWVTAAYGKGHYTYFAYALHRQLPYGVPGAYRLLANLLSLGK